MGAPALARRCGVRTKYASHLHPSCGWVPGAPPCIWTFLSSLGENGFFSILLIFCSHGEGGIVRASPHPVYLCPGMELFVDGLEVGAAEVGIDLGCADVGVAEHELDGTQVGPPLQ